MLAITLQGEEKLGQRDTVVRTSLISCQPTNIHPAVPEIHVEELDSSSDSSESDADEEDGSSVGDVAEDSGFGDASQENGNVSSDPTTCTVVAVVTLPDGEDELSGSEDELSGGEDELSDSEDELSGGEDELSGGEDELSGGENELSSGEDDMSGGVPVGEDELPASEDEENQGHDQMPSVSDLPDLPPRDPQADEPFLLLDAPELEVPTHLPEKPADNTPLQLTTWTVVELYDEPKPADSVTEKPKKSKGSRSCNFGWIVNRLMNPFKPARSNEMVPTNSERITSPAGKYGNAFSFRLLVS